MPGVPNDHVFMGRSESLEYPDAEAGEYTLRVENFAAAGDYRGFIELYESAGAIDTPVTEETWELTCESSSGQVLGQRSVHVERGEAADVGDLC